jgi:hypothetical protein
MTASALDVLRELLEKATDGPYSWTAEDPSMCTLHGKDYLYNHVLSVSPCESCQKGETEWKWGRCTTPSKDHADLIAAALNALPSLLTRIQELERERDEIVRKDAMMRLNNAHFSDQWVRLCAILGVDKIAIMETVSLVQSKLEAAESRALESAKDAARYQFLKERLHGADFAYGSPPEYVLTFKMPDDMRISANLDISLDAAIGERERG